MKKDPIIRMMSLFALGSVLGLIVLSVHNSLQSPYPLTVVRLEKVLGEQNTVKYENNSQSMKEYVKTGNNFSQPTDLDQMKKANSSKTENTLQKETSSQTKFPMNINQADTEDLMQVEGIGEKRAQSILDYRNQKGRISSMEELLEIDGIGEVLLSRLSEKFYAE